VILNGRVHKLGQVEFSYERAGFQAALAHGGPDGRLDLTFTPFVERVATTNLLLIRQRPCISCSGAMQGHGVTDAGEAHRVSTGWWALRRNITHGGDRCMTP
jgi:hypothetical protein